MTEDEAETPAAEPRGPVMRVLTFSWSLIRPRKRKAGWTITRLLLLSTGLAMVVLVSGACISMASPSPTWHGYKSEIGHFQVLLPGTPILREARQPGPDGDVVNRIIAVDGGAMRLSYVVSFCDYPAGTWSEYAPDNALKMLRQQLLTQLGAKADKVETVKLGTHPGNAFTFRTAKGDPMQARFYLVGDRVYYLWAGPVHHDGAAAQVKKFFTSFTLVQ